MESPSAAPEPTKEVSLEEALSIGLLFQRNGQLQDAETVYIKILSVEPDHPDVLHYAGILAHQLGRSDEGAELIERSLQLVPDRADCFSNLGIIFKAQGRFDDAVVAYERALALDPRHPNAHSNLGVLLRAQGKLGEAEAAYRKAIELNPEHIDAHHNLGLLLSSQKRTKEAMECYCRVTTLSPQHPAARKLLALAHCALGERDKAVEIFERWLEEEPDSAVARHMLAAVSGRDVPRRASDRYVESSFDDFAASFEVKLAHLLYRAPDIVGALLVDAGLTPAKDLDVLDAGCGTGLCGPHVAPFARRLVGVDLSSGMLAQAKEKQVYDELVHAELTGYISRHTAAFDVIVSADTLVYFGALDEVVAAAARALRPRGQLVFTVEAWNDAGPLETYRIAMHGRYSHAEPYVRGLLVAAGLQPTITAAELRMESGAPVVGLAVSARKPA
jgi:predicted TPR repeat methyltransferase